MTGLRLRRHFGKILFLAVFGVAAVSILFRADVLSVTANSTLNCYDSAGNYESCATGTSASPSRFNGRTSGPLQPASWTATALYQQATWTRMASDQAANWTTDVVDQASDRATSAPVTRRSLTLGRHPANCRRHLIPCFVTNLRRGFTRIASAAATLGHARPAREHL
jgi:hypothetical protein